jgi:hypothetical protein
MVKAPFFVAATGLVVAAAQNVLALSLCGDIHLAALCEVDRRIEDNPIARLDPGVHFHPRAKIAGHSDLADLRLAIVDQNVFLGRNIGLAKIAAFV